MSDMAGYRGWRTYREMVEYERRAELRRRAIIAAWVGAVAALAGWLAGRCI